jgi:hypothetical protein
VLQDRTAIMTSVCGVLNTQAFFASTGLMMRTDEAREMVGACALRHDVGHGQRVGSGGGTDDRIDGAFRNQLLAFCTASVVSLASSRTRYSTPFRRWFWGTSRPYSSPNAERRRGSRRRHGNADLDLRLRHAGNVSIVAATPQMMVLFIEPPRCLQPFSDAIIAEPSPKTDRSAARLDA